MKKKSRIPRVRASWVVTATLGGAGLLGGCAPPPVPEPCPVAAPEEGAACAPVTAGSCGYDPCLGDDDFTKTAECVDGQWVVSQRSCNPPPPPREVCPPLPPANAVSCRTPDLTCGYNDCVGHPTIQATCDGKTWSVSHRSCNPPPPPSRDGGSGV